MEHDEPEPMFESIEDAAEFFRWSPELLAEITMNMLLTDPRVTGRKKGGE